jgi:hypothetical protein
VTDPGFHATLIELIDALAAGDPRCRRFGAASHRWARRPVLTPARVAAIEAAAGVALPEDHRGYVIGVGDGGAGPYHGILPLDHPAQHAVLAGPCELPATPGGDERSEAIGGGDPAARGNDRPGGPAGEAGGAGDNVPRGIDWRGVIAIADLGCDQVAVLVVDGPARGTVWADARAAGHGVVPLAASFAELITAGLVAAARGELPPAIVPAGSCATPRLLSALLAHEEARLGRDPGTLAGRELRAVLAGLGPGAIAIGSAGTLLHARGEPIAPCVQCALLVDNLAASGLDPAALAAPVPPRPLRAPPPPPAHVRPVG